MPSNTPPNGAGLPALPLPEGISEDYIDCTSSCGLNFHILKAGKPKDPLILFCHGYPELAFSWRKIMPSIAAQGYYCVAMDQRGYGRTTGWDQKFFHEVDLNGYTITNLVRDLVCLVYGLGYTTVHTVIGHDFGGVSSASTALMRPDIFKSTIQMSHPHHSPPTPPSPATPAKPSLDIQAELRSLNPPRKHYKWYNSTPVAAGHWEHPQQGLETYLRGYFHLKSATWKRNNPHPLTEWSAKALEEMPEYYIMREADTFPETIARNMAGEDVHASESWLSREALSVYVSEWSRTGFQGALNWYRAQTASTPQSKKDMFLFAGRRIEVPVAFISGKQDWGNFQQPGALESYKDDSCVKKGCFRGSALIDQAGHWVQQEQPEKVVLAINAFLRSL
jgi:pimeloyl-ACP methyl ester carboxylesterase